ncbi:MAG: hypothetical protein PHF86_13500 [Candidatus Nanoarchaeia archaeon]|nr:hypothetical protein [Candidatus Nanoarchaeia archaeon]
MELSTILVFSIFKNIEKYIKSKNYDQVVIFTRLPEIVFKRVKPYQLIYYKNIYNDLENHYYTPEDLAIYLLYMYMMNKKIHLQEVNQKSILQIKNYISIKQLKADKVIIREVKESLKIKNDKEFFSIKEDGTSIIYNLTIKGFISPSIFIKYYDILLTTKPEDDIFKSEEYIVFEKSAIKIKEILKRRISNEQKEVSS